jgi:hypothetical protein
VAHAFLQLGKKYTSPPDFVQHTIVKEKIPKVVTYCIFMDLHSWYEQREGPIMEVSIEKENRRKQRALSPTVLVMRIANG